MLKRTHIILFYIIIYIIYNLLEYTLLHYLFNKTFLVPFSLSLSLLLPQQHPLQLTLLYFCILSSFPAWHNFSDNIPSGVLNSSLRNPVDVCQHRWEQYDGILATWFCAHCSHIVFMCLLCVCDCDYCVYAALVTLSINSSLYVFPNKRSREKMRHLNNWIHV